MNEMMQDVAVFLVYFLNVSNFIDIDHVKSFVQKVRVLSLPLKRVFKQPSEIHVNRFMILPSN